MATTAHIEVVRGDDALFDATILDGDGVVVDITGFTAKFTVKKNALDSSAIIEKTTTSGITLTDPTNGVMRVTLSGSDNTIDIGKYQWDIEITNTSSQRATALRGNYNVVSDVSR